MAVRDEALSTPPLLPRSGGGRPSRLPPLIHERRAGVESAFAVLVSFVFAVLPARAAEVYIGLTYDARGEAPLIGLAPFASERADDAGDRALAAQTQEVVQADLLLSRWFRLDDKGPAPEAELKSAFEAWKSKGAAGLITARVSAAGGKAALEARLYDLSAKKAIFEKRYETEKENWRALAHRASDEIVFKLTGKPGIARSHIAFVSDKTGNKEVFVVDYDGEGAFQVTRDRSLCLLPRWSKDATQLFYTTYRYGNPDIYQTDIYERKPRPVTSKQGLNMPGALSSDGNTLVLTAAYDGGSANLYLLDLKSRELRQLTHHTGADSSGSFSPDAREVAFVSDRSGNPQVHVLEVDTGRTAKLTDLNWCDSPAWQPTGEWIAFSGRVGLKDKMDIYLVDPTGTRLKQLTRDSGSNENPTWSPDGRFLAFTSNRDGRRRLYVMDADGSAPHAVGDLPGNTFTPAWSPQ